MRFSIIFFILMFCISCNSPQREQSQDLNTRVSIDNTVVPERELSQEFNDYWYSGVAEISNYDLKQTRYGEERDGNAVFIYVTEPFDMTVQIKADQDEPENQSVLKLNATRDFYTGIYPYKIMSSTFLPLEKESNAIKVATSVQEWCGHTYMQLNQNGDYYNGTLFSYFQSEGNTEFEVANVLLENQIPAQLRLGPDSMPTGPIKIIPSTEYLRLTHEQVKVNDAIASIENKKDTTVYSIEYKSGRMVSYIIQSKFPYQILSWSEEFENRGNKSTAIATLKKTLRTPYWRQNSNEYSVLRDSLGL